MTRCACRFLRDLPADLFLDRLELCAVRGVVRRKVKRQLIPLQRLFKLGLGVLLRLEGGPVDKVLSLHRKAQERPYASQPQRAAAMRGEAVALIDLGRFDEATTRLNASLAIEDSKSARGELDYIERLRRGEGKAPIEVKAR